MKSALATLLGALANVSHVKPVATLVWAAVINGIVAVPVMVLLMPGSGREHVMGKFRVSRIWAVMGRVATGLMGLASGVLHRRLGLKVFAGDRFVN